MPTPFDVIHLSHDEAIANVTYLIHDGDASGWYARSDAYGDNYVGPFNTARDCRDAAIRAWAE
jgi:hypothetical protein